MIEEIRLRNYRTCKNVKIQFKAPMMALLGMNGVGKTNTLKGIRLACNRAAFGTVPEKTIDGIKGEFAAEFKIKFKKTNYIYKFKFIEKKNLYIHDSLEEVRGIEKILLFKKRGKSILTVINRDKPIRIQPNYSGFRFITLWLISKEKTPDYLKSLSKYSQLFVNLFISLADVKYYPVQSQSNLVPITKAGYEKWKNKTSTGTEDEIFSYKYFDCFNNYNEDYREFESIVKSLKLAERINMKEYQAKGYEHDKSGNMIYWNFDLFDNPVPFHWLSDGTKRVLYILFCLFYDKATIMLIEEPESSIHWGLLIKLISILQSYSGVEKKILISTHSEQILNELNPEQLIYLYLYENTTKFKYIAGKTLNIVKGFLSEIGPLGEFMTSGKIEEVIDD